MKSCFIFVYAYEERHLLTNLKIIIIMYQSKVEYHIGSMYEGSIIVSHYNEMEDGEIILRAKRLVNYKGSLGMSAEYWKVISTDYHE